MKGKYTKKYKKKGDDCRLSLSTLERKFSWKSRFCCRLSYEKETQEKRTKFSRSETNFYDILASIHIRMYKMKLYSNHTTFARMLVKL